MNKRTKWLLIVVLGLMAHLNLLVFARGTLQGFENSPTMTAFVLPFGQLNYQQVTTVATIEQLLLMLLWVVFAIALLRDSN
ncbi:MAG: hypothetical protein C4557_12225 [Anaerolineaceae bacterium]|jgi:hypothetical protein|nr:MAG: hypothetical protein C4557_12225 [Anaerolineaceae bacterium]